MTATLEAIYTDFHSKLHRFIVGRVADPATAEDILQDVYVKIHSHIHGLRETDHLESWIDQITRNAIIDYYRRAHPLDELSDSFAARLDDEPDAVSELATSVNDMLGCLPEKCRLALEITDLQGFSQMELTNKLNITVSGANHVYSEHAKNSSRHFWISVTLNFIDLGGSWNISPSAIAARESK